MPVKNNKQKAPDPVTSRRAWWDDLETQWKSAFRESKMLPSTDQEPTDDALKQLLESKVVRLAGPGAFHPNLSFELTNLSGVREMRGLEILIVVHHQIPDLDDVRRLTKLKSLFVHNNQLRSLSGIKSLTTLEQLYVQDNLLTDLEPLQNLLRLRELYAQNNELSSLTGLSEQHSDTLTMFKCRPNPKLPQREIIRTENQLGIRCQ